MLKFYDYLYVIKYFYILHQLKSISVAEVIFTGMIKERSQVKYNMQ